MTESELIVILGREISDLDTQFDSDDYADCVDNAERDTGFSFPTSDAFQIKWLKERAKRHLIFQLLTKNADKFRVKQIHLQNRFEHYIKMIEMMDEAFDKAQIEHIYEFAQVDSSHAFGHKVDSGFAYDNLGRDITYDEDQLVIVSPGD
jgi:hypothetical protein